MKFIYQYRTPDNKSHKGVIKAASKEAAYAALKAKGVKPGRVEDAPGFFNKLFGKGKRWIAIAVLSLAVVGATVYFATLPPSVLPFAERGQIYGDASVLQQHESEGWADVFADPGDRILAAFAQPGKPVASSLVPASFNTRPVRIAASDLDEVKRMKQIVNGMKRELERYLASGGNEKGYYERLVERQSLEGRIVENLTRDIDALRRQAERSYDKEELLAKWREKNATLRDMGFKTIPLPEDWEMSELENKGVPQTGKVGP